ncbi:hypothetical protein GCM10007859_15940 [Brevundimonas denitrificans]|uniref:Uncharacterized protein n=1 Tax=Brevundimonas denitrificans TaxID=1443434 RepID=A0ABQ6BJH3_9CAUL|nr:hypothetical protein [Brevundimonas denitrificans]GLS01579.1 hypothetical protein GCM10007859_15940 [Brevundimonas denitrificans]
MRRLLLIAVLALVPTVALAQEPAAPPAPPAAEIDPGAAAPVGLSERFTAAFIGLEPAGEPEVHPAARRDQPVLIAPLRLVEEGRLDATIATADRRMAAGTLVTHRRFSAGVAAEQSDRLEAWCGIGEERRGSRWSPATVCMVHTPDGQANLGGPLYSFFPWWLVTSLTFADVDARAPRVAVTPAASNSAFSLTVAFVRIREGQVRLSRRIVGPGQEEGRTSTFPMTTVDVPMTGGVAAWVYDGLELTLTPNRYRDALTVTSRRIAPPVDQTVAGGEGLARALRADDDEDAAPIEPTPGVIGGVLLRPERLAVAAGPVARGGVLASGSMEHARTGRFRQDTVIEGSMSPRIAAGTVAHRVEVLRTSALGTRSLSTFWCAPVSAMTVFGRQDDQQTCFRRRGGRYEGLWPDTGRSWLTTTDRSSTPLSRYLAALDIEESDTDLIGPMDVRFELQRLTPTLAVVRILARREEQDALVMTVSQPVENGTAVFPLWTHRLVLSVAGEQATATLAADGDGSGLAEVGAYP